MPGYNNLIVDIPAYLMNNSEELSSALSSIIVNAQFRLSRDLNVVAFNTTVTGTLTVGSYQIARPSDLIRPIYLQLISGTSTSLLEIKTQPFVIAYEPSTASSAYGCPIYYAPDTFTNYRLTPLPDAPYGYTLNYQQQLADLTSTNSTNWLTNRAYDALLYACCADGARFVLAMGDQQQNMIQMYETRYQQAVQQINSIDQQSERDDTRVPTLDADNR